jgi:hypothetical protein
MSNISDQEAKLLLNQVSELKEIPADVSARLEAKLSTLANNGRATHKSRLSLPPLKYVAGIVLISSLALTFSINSSQAPEVSTTNPSQSTNLNESGVNTSSKTDVKESEKPIPKQVKGRDYSNPDYVNSIPLPSGSSFFGNLEGKAQSETCISSLGLNDSLNFVDSGTYKGKKVISVWSMKSNGGWTVTVLGANCEVLDRYSVDG